MKIDKTTQAARYLKLIAGFEKHYKPNQLISINGNQVKVASVVESVQTMVDLSANTQAAFDAWHHAVDLERETAAAIASTVRAVRNIVAGSFGESSKQMTDFGFPKRKPGKKTVAVKAEALKKGQSTREARHTMGPKEKKKIKGATTVVTTTGSTSNAGASTASNTTGEVASANGATTSNGASGKGSTTLAS